MTDSPGDYTSWTTPQLISRVTELESRLSALTASATANSSTPTADRRRQKRAQKDAANGGPKAFDPSRYSTRYIALKFAYLGQRYNGLEHHVNNITPLPTVEEELWKALWKTRLVLPTSERGVRGEVDWEGCEYSKCGRTDKGVSAFGQVVALRVRSARPLPRRRTSSEDGRVRNQEVIDDGMPLEQATEESEQDEVEPERPFDPVKDELPYIQLLNRVLPEDIRILAWCAPPEDFSARHSCQERRYRYFFTNPAFAPVPGKAGLLKTVQGKPLREGWLDVEAMRAAAKNLEGLHDFRNFCKVDGARGITNYERRIYHADIREIDQSKEVVGYVGQEAFQARAERSEDGLPSSSHSTHAPSLLSFDVNGSAFLWHQVRNMVAVLFLVGQGLETPSIVTELLDVEKNPTRPKYEMAADAPLVLWDCIFKDEDNPDSPNALKWIRAGDVSGVESLKKGESSSADAKFGRNGLMESLWSTWRQRKIEEVLAGSLIDLAAGQGRREAVEERIAASGPTRSMRLFDGSNEPRTVGPYVPVMKKDRMEHFEVINSRFRERKPYVVRPGRGKRGDGVI